MILFRWGLGFGNLLLVGSAGGASARRRERRSVVGAIAARMHNGIRKVVPLGADPEKTSLRQGATLKRVSALTNACALLEPKRA